MGQIDNDTFVSSELFEVSRFDGTVARNEFVTRRYNGAATLTRDVRQMTSSPRPLPVRILERAFSAKTP
jgi:hypothetical protein